MAKDFESWKKEFRASRLGGNSLRNLKDMLSPISPSIYPEFEHNVLTACFYAASFNAKSDKAEQQRKRWRDLKLNLAHKRIKDIERLRGFFERYDKELSRAIEKNFPKEDTSFKSIEDIDWFFNDLLVLLDCLEEDENYNNISFQDSYTFGNLKYKNAIDNNGNYKRANPTTLLIFELVIHIRLWTKDCTKYLNALKKRENGILLPNAGKPHYKLIASLVNATFPKGEFINNEKRSIDSDTVKFRLKDIPKGTLLIDWDMQ